MSQTPRERRTKDRMRKLRDQIEEALYYDHPQSVRHIFYRMTDPRLAEPVEKSDRGYVTVQRLTVQMREEGMIPYGWITDSTRYGQFTDTWTSPSEAVAGIAALYRRSYWASAPVYLEVWTESRSISGVVWKVCKKFAVPLYPSGGFASLSLVWGAAQHISDECDGRPCHILYIGDYDPAGLLIDRKIEAGLRSHLGDQELHFHRLGITAEQIALMGLPTKPAKDGDRRGGFTGGTVEAEAMPAATMRKILSDAIEAFIDRRELAVLEQAEASERAWIENIAGAMRHEEASQ